MSHFLQWEQCKTYPTSYSKSKVKHGLPPTGRARRNMAYLLQEEQGIACPTSYSEKKEKHAPLPTVRTE